jgi:hypothetical protein
MSKEKRIEKSRRLKDVVYPIFQECSKLVKDDFWIKLFDDLSRGKCPKGVMIYNNVLSSSLKRNGFSYNFIENKTPEVLVSEIPEILKKSVCIYSEKDIINKENIIQDATQEYMSAKSTDNWKKIKSKKMKENLITNYCLEMKKKYKMSYYNSKVLYDTIKDALYVFKTHKSDSIVMKNGKIDYIKDINYSEDLAFFLNEREIEDENITKNNKKNKNENVLDTKWKNYLSIIIKETVKNQTD